MNNETLLDMAWSNYSLASDIKQKLAGDEVYLNYIGYHLQQAMELALKHHLETIGIRYTFTHDIGELMDADYIPEYDLLYPAKDTITKWESRTRYIKNYRLSAREIDTIMPNIKKLLLDLSPCHMKPTLYRKILKAIPDATSHLYGSTDDEKVINFYAKYPEMWESRNERNI